MAGVNVGRPERWRESGFPPHPCLIRPVNTPEVIYVPESEGVPPSSRLREQERSQEKSEHLP